LPQVRKWPGKEILHAQAKVRECYLESGKIAII